MKKLLFLLLVLSGCCTCPKIQMRYCVNLADHGTILCRDYQINGDTLRLFDAGHFVNLKYQSRVSDVKAIGFKQVLIVEIK
jgi:hypothetical protein